MAKPKRSQDAGSGGAGVEPVSAQASPDVGATTNLGPDPVVGATVALLGILMMGIAGAATAHYAFNFGTLVALSGAAMFVFSMALSAWKQRRGRRPK